MKRGLVKVGAVMLRHRGWGSWSEHEVVSVTKHGFWISPPATGRIGRQKQWLTFSTRKVSPDRHGAVVARMWSTAKRIRILLGQVEYIRAQLGSIAAEAVLGGMPEDQAVRAAQWSDEPLGLLLDVNGPAVRSVSSSIRYVLPQGRPDADADAEPPGGAPASPSSASPSSQLGSRS